MCFLPLFLAQGRHPPEHRDRLRVHCMYGLCLWSWMSFVVCVRSGAELRDSFSVWSFISVFLKLWIITCLPYGDRPIMELSAEASHGAPWWGLSHTCTQRPISEILRCLWLNHFVGSSLVTQTFLVRSIQESSHVTPGFCTDSCGPKWCPA